jgi:divalent metal cation (Fe/Co/Zn/Cd) transporter
MDEHVHDDLIEKIRATSNQVEGIIDTEKCFIRKAGMKYHVDLHAIVNAMITVKRRTRFST